MAVPDYETLMLPVLREAAKGETSVRALIPLVAREFHLAPEDLEETVSSGRALVYSRVHWAKTYLAQAGLLESPRRGVFVATERGRTLLKDPPERITCAYLRRYEEFVAFEARARPGKPAPPGTPTPPPPPSSPEDQMAAAFGLITASLRDELLRLIVRRKPWFLEKVVLDLLLAMQYGDASADAAIRLGRTGDGGVDGVIKQDPLGLDVIYVQAKRFKRDLVVGEKLVREFSGSLVKHGATRGVFVTTSTFSEPARRFVKDNRQQRIVLIDGEEFAGLLIRHEIGVRKGRAFEIKQVDPGYYPEEEEPEEPKAPEDGEAT